ncbi:hypothetical protein RJ639_003197 [Escallonia herrerae]|uniref:Uncharacterized protein n=1 Tax=Escallonia herrerae TaxID=1293975 RepID=A0AA88W4C9_9ASTE|nr:hypothetical protein RJ639_003197 [Escallonia herrerae]
MTIGGNSLTARLLVLVVVTILHRVSLNSVSASCEFSIVDHNKLYNYSLASPSSKFPHGVLSEDGFYKVAGNGTVLWFQLCDGMIFNHDRPTCLDCTDCGGPSRCGMGCSALVTNSIGGYHVCRTVGFATSMSINLIDTRRPHMGVVVVMSNRSPMYNCSVSVSVLCDLVGVQGPQTLEKVGICGYATQLSHPSGCARIVSAHGNGWGWFGGIMTLYGFHF